MTDTTLAADRLADSAPPRSIGAAFDPRRNSLNFLRLLLAVTVVASHSIDLGLFGRDWIGDRTTIGELAVFGFFGISGFLIARSAEGNSTGRYLWQRVIRIFPAFWVCLLVTAFGIGLVGWLHLESLYHVHSTVSDYLHAPYGPWGYIEHNWYLKMDQDSIITTVWNGSLWTLFYEFLCYLMLGALALVGVLRRRHLVLTLFVALWITEAVLTINRSTQATTTRLGTEDVKFFIELSVVFLAGTLIYLYRDHVRDSGWIALGCAAVLVSSLWLPFGGQEPSYTLTSTELLAPLIAYPVLWLGFHLPFTTVGSKNDYSYGVYIYAYPIAILLGPFGAANHGYLVFFALTLVFTVPLAVASWWLIERPALKLRRWTPGPFRRSAPLQEVAEEPSPATPAALVDGAARLPPAPTTP